MSHRARVHVCLDLRYRDRLREAMDRYFMTIPGKFTLIEEQNDVHPSGHDMRDASVDAAHVEMS